MQIVPHTAVPDVKILTPRQHADARGWFAEIFRSDRCAEAGIHDAFVQDNLSLSREKGTIRGLHFQTGPAAQAKLVRCVQGRIFDVVVDLRVGSPTYGRHAAIELSAEQANALYVPIGFAHGLCTLEVDCAVSYKVSAYYDAPSDDGISFDDPALAIAWPEEADHDLLSAKDRVWKRLAERGILFRYSDNPAHP